MCDPRYQGAAGKGGRGAGGLQAGREAHAGPWVLPGLSRSAASGGRFHLRPCSVPGPGPGPPPWGPARPPWGPVWAALGAADRGSSGRGSQERRQGRWLDAPGKSPAVGRELRGGAPGGGGAGRRGGAGLPAPAALPPPLGKRRALRKPWPPRRQRERLRGPRAWAGARPEPRRACGAERPPAMRPPPLLLLPLLLQLGGRGLAAPPAGKLGLGLPRDRPRRRHSGWESAGRREWVGFSASPDRVGVLRGARSGWASHRELPSVENMQGSPNWVES